MNNKHTRIATHHHSIILTMCVFGHGVYPVHARYAKAARRAVEASPLGAAVSELFDLGGAPFDWDSGRVRRVLLKEVLPGMETFVHATHGWRWTRLDTLIDSFDDRAALMAEVGGFGEHVVGDAATQLHDEEGAEAFMLGGDPSAIPRR